MRLAADPEAAAWLEGLDGRLEEFDWDAGNRGKTAKHGVETEEVEAILRHPIVFAGRIAEPRHEESRWLLLGVNEGERPLALVFTRRGNKIRPISCRSMRRKERKLYEDAIAQELAAKED